MILRTQPQKDRSWLQAYKVYLLVKLCIFICIVGVIPLTIKVVMEYSDISGTYAITRAGQDGSQAHTGTVVITAVDGNRYAVSWTIDGETTQGNATLSNGMLIAEDGTLVVHYELMPDGRMEGRWTQLGGAGTGTDVLIPAAESGVQ